MYYKVIRITVFTLFMGLSAKMSAQDFLTRSEALEHTLQHNYDIKVAVKSVEIAENNKSILNSGYLPTATVNGNANITGYQGENETANGTIAFDQTEAYSYGAVASLNYTLFDGLGRYYNYKQFQEQYHLTNLQARQIMENTVLELSNSYFQISQLTESVNIFQNALSISSSRLQRAKYSFEYGQSTQIDVLNAQVDVNNDSINLLNTKQLLENEKRNLNLIMGRDIETSFTVDTNVTFSIAFTKEELVQKAAERNITIEQTRSQLKNSEYAISASRSGWFPSLSANAGFNYNGSQNPASPFLKGSSNYGPQAGLSLTWNLFDGGRTSTQLQNAKIQLQSQKISLEQTESSVKRDVLNAFSTYQNALFVMNAEKANLKTTVRNFERSEELYQQGQITSIEFRQAQLNMRNAQNSYSIAKYSAKFAELQVKQLAGILLD